MLYCIFYEQIKCMDKWMDAIEQQQQQQQRAS